MSAGATLNSLAERGHWRSRSPPNSGGPLRWQGDPVQRVRLLRSSLYAGTFRARANRSKVARLILRVARSTFPTKLRSSPAARARASCDMPIVARSDLRLAARISASDGRQFSEPDTCRTQYLDAFESTVYKATAFKTHRGESAMPLSLVEIFDRHDKNAEFKRAADQYIRDEQECRLRLEHKIDELIRHIDAIRKTLSGRVKSESDLNSKPFK